MVTQKDVAALAGVSFITVSRVVNGETNVSEPTRKKVLAAIDKLGYAPSFAGQLLNSGRCNTIAILTPIPFEKSARIFYLMRVLSGIEKACRKQSIDMILGVVPEVSDRSTYDYLRPFRQKKVDGIIYIGMRELPGEMTEELSLRHLPCVVVGDRPETELVSWVDTDNFQAEYDTVRTVWSFGHRHMAFVGLEKGIYNANITDREKGFVQALKDLGASCRPEDCIIRTDYDSTGLEAKLAAFFRQGGARPTALLCAADFAVPKAVAGIVSAGLSVPGDVGIVGFDGAINDTNYYLKVATNVQPLKEMGAKAAEMLFAHIRNPEAERQTAVFPVAFEQNDSLVRLLP